MSMLTQREQGQAAEILGPSTPDSTLPSSTYFAYAHLVSMTATSKHFKIEEKFSKFKENAARSDFKVWIFV